MADINNNDIWIDVETLAKLKNITRRAVRHDSFAIIKEFRNKHVCVFN